MCDNCLHILGSCVRKHLPKDCCLKRASYCTGCSAYGHTFNNCSNKSYNVEYLEQLIPTSLLEANNINTNTPYVRSTTATYMCESIEYIEQLIPINLLKEYGIGSYTPIGKPFTNISPMKPTIDVLDNPKAIRDLLKAYGQMPKKDNRNKDKYKIYLEKFAKKNNYNIVYHLDKKDETTVEYE